MQIDTAQKVTASVVFTQSGAVVAAPAMPVWTFEPAGMVDLVVDTDPNTVEISGMVAGSGTLTMTAGDIVRSAALDVIEAIVPVDATITFGVPVAR